MTAHYDPILDFENRKDRGIYDEETPSTICHPNGTYVCSFDRPFLVAATREVLDLLDVPHANDTKGQAA